MPTYQPFDWYHTPLYYDIIFDADTLAEAQFLEQAHAKHATPTNARTTPPKPAESRSDSAGSPPSEPPARLTILEPACGSGRLMATLAARGHRVAGLDLSEGMLNFAKQRFADQNIRAKLIKAPMQNFDLHAYAKPSRGHRSGGTSGGGGYDVAHVLVSSFKYLLTEDDAAAALGCICDHLRPGGIFVLGLHLTEYDHDKPALERWRAQRDGLDVICTIRSGPADPARRLEPVRSRIVARHLDSPGSSEPQRYETNWQFRSYDEDQLESLLRKEPRLQHVGTYTFHHDINQPTEFGGEDLGVVLVLRRRE